MPVEYLKNIQTGRVFPATQILIREAARSGKLVPCNQDGNPIQNPEQSLQEALPDQATDLEPPYYRPDSKVVDDLMERYPFEETFDLRSRLDDAYLNRESAAMLVDQDNPVAKMKDHLKVLHKHCASLHTALGKINMNERELLRSYWALGESLRRLENDTAIVREIAGNALDDLNGQKSTRKGDLPFRIFVTDLGKIWTDGTGQDPKVVHDRNTEDFKGPFFELVIECLRLAGIRYQSRGAVGKALQRALNEETA